MNRVFFSALLLAAFAVPGVAAAQYPPAAGYTPPPQPGGFGYAPPTGYAPARARFSDAGHLAISNDLNTSLVGNSRSDNGGSDWSLNLHPAADYFVIQGLSVGGFVDYTHKSVSTSDTLGTSVTISTDSFGIGPRVGYDLPLGDVLSFWPKVGVAFTYMATGGYLATGTPAGALPPGNGNAFTLSFDAPLLYHPVSHLFLGLGPRVSTDLSSSYSPNSGASFTMPKTTSFGLVFTLGGWFGF